MEMNDYCTTVDHTHLDRAGNRRRFGVVFLWSGPTPGTDTSRTPTTDQLTSSTGHYCFH